VKKAAESATAELRLSLQKERDRAEALAPGRESMQSTIGARSCGRTCIEQPDLPGTTGRGGSCDRAASGH